MKVLATAGVLTVALIGCAYKPGTFRNQRGHFLGERHTVGCLDVAVRRMHDAVATGTVAAVAFGNRCDQPTTIDLAAIRAIAYAADGTISSPALRDPDGVIQPTRIGARKSGTEYLEYQTKTAVAQLCLDLTRVDAEARKPHAAIVCMNGSQL